MRLVNSPETIDNIRVVQDYDEMLTAIKENRETIMHWEFGNSLAPLINNKEYCCITPLLSESGTLMNGQSLKVGDCVFCKVNGYLMVHMIWMISTAHADGRKRYLIGSSHGSMYGWTSDVYGIAKGTDVFEDVEDPPTEDLM